MAKIEAKKRAFALNYYKTGKKRESAIAAGYSERAASQAATRLLKDADVLAEIERLENQREKVQAPETIEPPEPQTEEIEQFEPKTIADIYNELQRVAFMEVPQTVGAAAIANAKISALKALIDIDNQKRKEESEEYKLKQALEISELRQKLGYTSSEAIEALVKNKQEHGGENEASPYFGL